MVLELVLFLPWGSEFHVGRGWSVSPGGRFYPLLTFQSLVVRCSRRVAGMGPSVPDTNRKIYDELLTDYGTVSPHPSLAVADEPALAD